LIFISFSPLSFLIANELKERGFQISGSTLSTARKHREINGAGAPVPKPQAPASRKPTEEATKEQIQKFFYQDDVSLPAANRVISSTKKGETRTIPVRHVECCFSCAFTKFKKQLPDLKVSESTFRRNIPKEIKKPLKKSDLCPICHKGRFLEKRLKEVEKIVHRGCTHAMDLDHCLKCPREAEFPSEEVSNPVMGGESILFLDDECVSNVSNVSNVCVVCGGEDEEECGCEEVSTPLDESEPHALSSSLQSVDSTEAEEEDDREEKKAEETPLEKLRRLRNQFQLLQDHKKRKDEQRESFRQSLKNLKPGKALLILDFKENILLGGCSEEIHSDFYNKQPHSVLGIVVYHVEKEGEEAKAIFHDFISNVLSHDTRYVRDCLMTLVSHQSFQNLKANELELWMDNGPAHFRTYEFIHSMKEVEEQAQAKLSWNFFGEYHGKSPCDQHFSVLSRILKSYENNSSIRISTTTEIIKMFENEFVKINENKNIRRASISKPNSTQELEPTQVFFHQYTRTTEPLSKYEIKVKGMTTFYSFAFRNGKLEARAKSTQETPSKIFNVRITKTEIKKSTRRSYQKEAYSESFDKYTANLTRKQKATELSNETPPPRGPKRKRSSEQDSTEVTPRPTKISKPSSEPLPPASRKRKEREEDTLSSGKPKKRKEN